MKAYGTKTHETISNSTKLEKNNITLLNYGQTASTIHNFIRNTKFIIMMAKLP